MKWNRSLPNGTKDKLFKEASLSHQLETLVNHHFKRRGYQRIETPLIEFEEVFDGMAQKATSRYRFFDDQGRIVVLRPDMTLPIGRVISTTGVIPPVQLFYSGKVFRVNKGHSGEYNEQLQAGMELIGYDSLKAETECLVNAIEVSQKSGLTDFQIELGHGAIFKTIMAELALRGKEAEQFKWLLQSKNSPGMQTFLIDYQEHELYPLVSRLPRLFGDEEMLKEVTSLTTHGTILAVVKELETLIKRVKQLYPEQPLTVDIGLVQAFQYYTGITFKGYTDQSPDAFLSGGRYDNLLTEFSVDPVPAVGLVFYLDRIIYIKERKGELRKPRGTQTLIHFEDDCLQVAEALLAKEPDSSLSLHQELEETVNHARQWHIPRVLCVSQAGVIEQVMEGGGSDA
ncbi:ATP phosphoribosyltransferase regulatory subunit [Vagococcus sp. BWB3-3]|uniref:ATP phosphoribosyltransferase regulatory subunit n=1 Tax=Vagococcus allomyrinae TaxID=2794353 RepID=A0A940PB25_9ENTE|nr:ATP phosphoribosyltransferase regulatory subunit [Vagococcus allomyrinae]MBP1044330.1 ATP phosphoribosyltransferase regulatory subunit [Vagococcus allomyrinae]